MLEVLILVIGIAIVAVVWYRTRPVAESKDSISNAGGGYDSDDGDDTSDSGNMHQKPE